MFSVFDSLIRQNSPCITEEFLLLSILDSALQFVGGQYGLNILQRAKEIQLTENFSGTNLQVILKKISLSHNDTLKTLSVSYLASQ